MFLSWICSSFTRFLDLIKLFSIFFLRIILNKTLFNIIYHAVTRAITQV